MAGNLIAMLRVLRLKAALQATVTSPEFQALGAFLDLSRVIMTEDFWTLLFIMCRVVYPQMRILRLADQKVPAMDKLAYFIYQAERLTPKFLAEAEQHIPKLSEGIMEIIDSTDDLASEEVDGDEDDEEDDRGSANFADDWEHMLDDDAQVSDCVFYCLTLIKSSLLCLIVHLAG